MSKLFLNGRLCNGNARSKKTLEDQQQYTLEELKQIAKDNGVPRYSALNKEALCQAILDFGAAKQPMIVGPPMVEKPVAAVPLLVRAKTPAALSPPRDIMTEFRPAIRRILKSSNDPSLSVNKIIELLVSEHGFSSALVNQNKAEIKGIVSEELEKSGSYFPPVGVAPAKKGRTAPADDERGCVEQHTKKYMDRDSPAFPANQCCGEIKLGNPLGKKSDKRFISKADVNGTCKWVLVK